MELEKAGTSSSSSSITVCLHFHIRHLPSRSAFPISERLFKEQRAQGKQCGHAPFHAAPIGCLHSFTKQRGAQEAITQSTRHRLKREEGVRATLQATPKLLSKISLFCVSFRQSCCTPNTLTSRVGGGQTRKIPTSSLTCDHFGTSALWPFHILLTGDSPPLHEAHSS